MIALALVLAVAGEDLLLLVDEVGGADRFLRGFRVVDQLLGKVLFLLGQLAGEGALVIQGLDLQIPDVQLGADADDPEQDVCFLLVGFMGGVSPPSCRSSRCCGAADAPCGGVSHVLRRQSPAA